MRIFGCVFEAVKRSYGGNHYYLWCCLGVIAISVAACSSGSRPQPRAIDPQPIRIPLAVPLSSTHVEAFFKLDTGRDQMLQNAKEAGLMVVVRMGAYEYQQTIASCSNPGLGSALGGGTERELEVALCDGEYWLITEPGRVSVMRMDRIPAGEPVTEFTLPAAVRAVAPQERQL